MRNGRGRTAASRRARPRRPQNPHNPQDPQIHTFSNPQIWRRAGLIAIVTILTYANSLFGPFILDDQAAIAANRQIREWWNLGAILSTGRDTSVAGRPLVNLSLAINYALGGLNVAGYHVWNIAVHVLCALVAFGIIRRSLELPALRDRFGGQALNLACAAALIWAVHPLASEAVDYLIQRTESMMALCYLFALYASIRAHASERSGTWQAAAVASSACGMACKESMVTAPITILLYDRAYVFERFMQTIRARWRFYVALMATWIVAFLLNRAGPRAGVVGFAAGIDPWTYLLNQAIAITHYLRLSVWPSPLVVFYGWPVQLTLTAALPYVAFVAALFTLTLAGWLLRSEIAFLGLWFFITLAPTSSIVPVATEVAAERRMYLPLLAIVVLIAAPVSRILTSRGAKAALAIGATVFLSAATIVRNSEYSSALSIAQTVVERRPTSIAHHIFGVELAAAGRRDEAIAHLRQAAPGDSRARYDLGVELFNAGKLDDAIAELQAFVATSRLPSRPVPHWLEPPPGELLTAHLVRGRALGQQLRWREATEEGQLALKIDASNAEARALLVAALTNLGVEAIAAGRIDDAVDAFGRAVETQPQNGDAQRNLANALIDRDSVRRACPDGLADAVSHARQAVSLAPNNSASYETLGRALGLQGRLDDARAQFERALQIDPANREAREDLLQIAGRPSRPR
jgi:tetratricopeptide (TPR) repeat protein